MALSPQSFWTLNAFSSSSNRGVWAVKQTLLIYIYIYIYMVMYCARVSGIVDPLGQRGFAPMHTLHHTNTHCGFSCGQTAHSDFDYYQNPSSPSLWAPHPQGSPSDSGHSHAATGSLPAAGARAGEQAKGKGENWGEDLLGRREKGGMWSGSEEAA